MGEIALRAVNLTKLKWDNLIILDACRYDIFKEVNDIEGDLFEAWSPGSDSEETIKATFNKYIPASTCIAGNPHLALYNVPRCFNIMFHAYQHCWDESKWEISDECITKAGVAASREFPNNKLVVWYMKPHIPYHHLNKEHIKSIKTLHTHGMWEQANKWDSLQKFYIAYFNKIPAVDRSAVLKVLYKSNLIYVLEWVKLLLKELSGTTIISSDHGEMLFDRVNGVQQLGHAHGKDFDLLHRIPLLYVK